MLLLSSSTFICSGSSSSSDLACTEVVTFMNLNENWWDFPEFNFHKILYFVTSAAWWAQALLRSIGVPSPCQMIRTYWNSINLFCPPYNWTSSSQETWKKRQLPLSSLHVPWFPIKISYPNCFRLCQLVTSNSKNNEAF